jgi:hypothetical protein
MPLALSLIACSIMLDPVLSISNGKAMKFPKGESLNACPALPT